MRPIRGTITDRAALAAVEAELDNEAGGELEAELVDTKYALEVVRGLRENMKRDLNRLGEELRFVKDHNRMLRSRVATLEAERATLMRTVSELKVEIDQLLRSWD